MEDFELNEVTVIMEPPPVWYYPDINVFLNREEVMPEEFEESGLMKTFTGKWFNFNYINPYDIELEDIANALSMLCRYNGHVPTFYSVAEHSCLVADWLDRHGYRHLAFAGLLHDAAEAYLGDMVRPMKRMPEFAEPYNQMESYVDWAIGQRFNVSLSLIDPIVKKADMAVYDWEVENIRTGKVTGLSPEEAKKRFLSFFEHYQSEHNRTKESEMKNDKRIADMTDEEIDELTQIEWELDREGNRFIDPKEELRKINEELEEHDRKQALIEGAAEKVEAEEAEMMPWGPRRTMLMNAADLVDGDRNAQYGDPRQDFSRTAAYWNTHIAGVIDRKLAENGGQMNTREILGMEDVAIMMGLLKVSRLSWQPYKEDTWTDLAGYAACGWDCAQATTEVPE